MIESIFLFLGKIVIGAVYIGMMIMPIYLAVGLFRYLYHDFKGDNKHTISGTFTFSQKKDR